MTKTSEISNKEIFLNIPRYVLSPIPVFVWQPILNRIITKITKDRQELFSRLGDHKYKTYLIDPLNMPFVLLLRPDPKKLGLRAVRRNNLPSYDARIAGTFLTLMDMVDGRLDGDALFFTRDLMIEGDTEAVVTLRNALDDLNGSVIEDAADIFGSAGRIVLALLHRIKAR